MKRRLYVIAVLIAGCGANRTAEEIAAEEIAGSAQAIINGQPESGQYPFAGNIVDGRGGLCGASLVGRRTILTAAHCVAPMAGASVRFVSSSGSYDVGSLRAHPNYRLPQGGNGRLSPDQAAGLDIGVGILSRDANITPIAISTSTPVAQTPVKFVASGRRSLNSNSVGVRQVGASVVSRVTSLAIQLSDTRYSLSCMGDSGAPLFETRNGKLVQIGIVSGTTASPSEPACGIDSVFARVDAYIGWVRQVSNGDVVVEQRTADAGSQSTIGDAGTPAYPSSDASQDGGASTAQQDGGEQSGTGEQSGNAQGAADQSGQQPIYVPGKASSAAPVGCHVGGFGPSPSLSAVLLLALFGRRRRRR